MSCGGLRQTVIMKRPCRDVLVWLAGIRPPDKDLAADRAIAAVTAMLAAYDRDPRLAARWEERFANSRTRAFPFGMSLRYRKLVHTYLRE
jgi:hypothetical protein